MKLDDQETAMLAGEMGPARRWAIEHQLQVGRMFDAEDMVAVSQSHMMADPESLGAAGVEFVENIAAEGARIAIPMITDPRGVDLTYYEPLGQTEAMADLERRFVAACLKMGIMMTDTCINYQTIMPPVLGDHVAYGDTGVVIYSNSVCGARSNFEGGPSALAAGLTGRTPRYGLHLDRHRQATQRYVVRNQPEGLTDWGVLGATIGRMAGSYWEVPVIEGIETRPTSDEIKHMGAAMASYGSTPLFHIVGITPECRTLADVSAQNLPPRDVTSDDLAALRQPFGAQGEAVDVVVFAAPQLSLVEMQQVASLCQGRKISEATSLLVCTSPSVYADAQRLHYNEAIQKFGGKVLQGTCFYQQYAREIGEANGWKRLLSNSTKIVNILGGYGYLPALASMEDCIASAEKGVIV
ncbi:aconitase X catalytic domain-containing protein [Sulfitobacter sp. S190]|uniref:aconitase X catalytic domain-containing protein n=1 Tax=Sulfitobacter sp. S190 TaxID=2867022 RepID=UPI0021A584CE|nr:aconitase X catalytic domain-containing protein [Sulfitobacter sp. S190]UWR24305.1 aconitase X catalytic domain-containing protein [Sulfitobacter sp. S190]